MTTSVDSTFFPVHLKMVSSQSDKYIWNNIKSKSKQGQIDPECSSWFPEVQKNNKVSKHCIQNCMRLRNVVEMTVARNAFTSDRFLYALLTGLVYSIRKLHTDNVFKPCPEPRRVIDVPRILPFVKIRRLCAQFFRRLKF